ncbi:MAG: hypothetical protein RLZ98_511 [Pseudomonadota bacterium]|jgi:uncharacterized protein (TIGR02301 family)
MRRLIGLLLAAATCALSAAPAFPQSADNRPYDANLLRLSEILGAVHYLRALCGADEGQAWRDRMQSILKVEGTTAARRAKFARSFNQGYHSYSRTYKACTPTAKVAVNRFLTEGASIAEELVEKTP